MFDNALLAKLVADIRAHLRAGGVVQLTTYLHSTLYDSRHVDCFRVGEDGSPLVRRGKHWDDFRGCGVRFGRVVTAKLL